MIKTVKFSSIIFSLCLIFVSCTQENNEDPTKTQEQELRASLGFTENLPSDQEREFISSRTEPIYFENVQDAKNFIDGVSKEFKFSFSKEKINSKIYKESLAKKKGSYTIFFDEGFALNVPCDSNFLDPYDGCEDGGGGSQNCGSGNVRMQSGNQSYSFYYNATFNYTSQNGTVSASNFNSHTSGVTIGTSYEHISSNHSVNTTGEINFSIRGALSYNIFVEGVGTVYVENVTLVGSFNPCSSNGNTGTLELYLQPAN